MDVLLKHTLHDFPKRVLACQSDRILSKLIVFLVFSLVFFGNFLFAFCDVSLFVLF